MIEQPKYTPHCCGQQAKWVNPTPNLAYFYCEKCKKEVVEPEALPDWRNTLYAKDYSSDALDAMLYATAPYPAQPPQVSAKPLLPPSVFRVGDKVSFEYDTGINTVREVGIIESISGKTYNVRQLGSNLRFNRFPSELTLLP